MKKIILFWVTMVIIMFFGCTEEHTNEHYLIENMYQIHNVYADSIDTVKNQVSLTFALSYYSDSNDVSFMSGGREKGMNGSKQYLTLLNSSVKTSRNIDSTDIDCRKNGGLFKDASSFVNAFNQKVRCVVGERLDRGIRIKIPDDCDEYRIELLIGERGNANNEDTIVLHWLIAK